MNVILGCQHASPSAGRLGSFDRKPSQWTMHVQVLLVLLCSLTAAVHAQSAVYNGGSTSTISSAFTGPLGVTTDSSGDIFVADNDFFHNTAAVYEMTYTAGTYSSPQLLPSPVSGFPCPAAMSESDPCLRGIAIDHNGYLWVAAFGDYSTLAGGVYVYSSGTSLPPVSVGTGTWESPWGITADTLGNVYVTDNAAQTITKIANGATLTPTLTAVYTYVTGATNGVQQPRGIAVDSSADLFVVDGNAGQVKELPTPYSGTPNTVSPGFQGPGDLALDANGNVWVSEFSTDLVGELAGWNATSSSFATVLSWGTGLSGPVSVWPDTTTGNILVSDSGNQAIKQIALKPANFGSVAVGSTSLVAQTLTFTIIGTTTTVGAPVIVTQGATIASDFIVGGSGNWSCTSNNGNTLCTVTVNFAPKAPGLRFGAIELQDTSNVVLATAPLYGTGTGPEIAFNPGASTTSFTGLGSGHLTPEKIAVDSSGNVFIADNNGGIFEITAGTTAANHICCATSLSEPYGIAIDGAGNLFVTQSTGVYEILAPGYTTVQQLAPGFSFSFPLGLAFDGNGNLYVADASAANKVDELTWASGYSNVITLSPSFGKPFGVAVDTSGNIWVADYGVSPIAPSVTELSATGVVSHTYSGFNTPEAIAADPAGNVYVADNGGSAITELVAANSYASLTLASSASVPAITDPAGVALDSAGNVYYTTDGTDDSAYKLNFASAPTLSFGTIPYQTASSAQPVTVTNIGTTGSDLNLTALAATSSFTLGTSAGDCTAPSSLVSDTIGASCDLSITFTPQATGSISGTATITDNAAGSPQIINLSGSGSQVTATVAAVNATAAYSPSAQNVTLTATVSTAGPTVNEGTVAFTVQGTTGGTVTSSTVSGGTASVTYVIPAGQTTGNYTIQAVYSDASGGFSSSTDTTHTLSIGLANQATLTVTGMPVTAQAYQATFTVGSSGGSGTGALTFAASGACSNTSGGALITMTSGTGTCSVTATKAADTNYNSTTSSAATVSAALAMPGDADGDGYAGNGAGVSSDVHGRFLGRQRDRSVDLRGQRGLLQHLRRSSDHDDVRHRERAR
jgi:large repetitive protein